MKKLATTLLLLSAYSMTVCGQHDIILLRDGKKLDVKVVMANTDNTTFISKESGTEEEQSVDNSQIYMVKYEKRGNVFYTENGEKYSGEGDGKIPSKADAIYLLDGKEIIAYNISMDTECVIYQPTDKKKASKQSIPKDDIFMICYRDGTREVINDFETVKQRKLAEEEKAKKEEEERRLAEWRKNFPKKAILVTLADKSYTILLTNEDEDDYWFTRNDIEESPLFQIKKKNVKSLNIQ